MTLLRLAAVSQALAVTALAAPVALRGEEVHCLRDRAHLLRFDVAGEPNDGSSLEGIERAVVSLEPSQEHSEHCLGGLGSTPSNHKQFCFGANQDAACTGAKEAVLPLEDGFECKDCFVAASADAFYKLNYSAWSVHSVSVGVNNLNVRASATVRRTETESDKPAVGKKTLAGTDKPFTIFDSLVGCPACVRVTFKIGVPTTLAYDLSWKSDGTGEAGASLDMEFGNNSIHWASGQGWEKESHSPTVTIKPALTATGKAEADVQLALTTSLQVSVDNVVWYHLDLDPSLPMKVTFDGGWGPFKPKAKTCINGDPSFEMVQEADLNWNLFKWHKQAHWGPSTLYSWSQKGGIHACEEVAANSSLLLV